MSLLFVPLPLLCQASNPNGSEDPSKRPVDGQTTASETPAPQPSDPAWQYGGFLDFAYLEDFNDPPNHLFRSRGTTFHVNEWDINMAAIYLRKTASEGSRWGTELTLQAGKDTQVFGFSATAPNLPCADWQRAYVAGWNLQQFHRVRLAVCQRQLYLHASLGR